MRAFDLFKSDAQDLRWRDFVLTLRADEVQAGADRFKVVFPAGWHAAILSCCTLVPPLVTVGPFLNLSK